MAESFADLEGWKELQAYLKELPLNIESRFLKKALMQAAVIVETAAKTTTEFKDKTGRLRKSIELEKKRNKKGVIRMGVKAAAPHAHLVERGFTVKTKKGSRHIPGRYFMTKALMNNRDRVLEEIKTVLGAEIKKFEKKKAAKLRKAARSAAK
jgi:HK97 gp10 family phage protein